MKNLSFRNIFKKTEGVVECMPLKKNPFVSNGKALVAIEKSSKDIEARVKAAVDAIGGFKKIISKGNSVLIKPNYVFPYPPPCITSLDFLLAVIKHCYKAGASQVVVGESSAWWVDTEKTMRKFGIVEAVEKIGAKVAFFDQGKWITVKMNSDVIQDAAFPEEAFKHDKIIFLPNMKTHRLARFTLSLKLSYGFLSHRYRTAQLHFVNLEKKIADVNKAIHPDLVIMDGRKCFVTQGPDDGDVREPNVILASGDRIAIDVEAIKILKSYNAKNHLIYDNPFQYEQIRRAVELGLGVKSQEEITVKVVEKQNKL